MRSQNFHPCIGHTAVGVKHAAGYLYQFTDMSRQQHFRKTIAHAFVQHVSDKVAGVDGRSRQLRRILLQKTFAVIARCEHHLFGTLFAQHRQIQRQRFFKRFVGHRHHQSRCAQHRNATQDSQPGVERAHRNFNSFGNTDFNGESLLSGAQFLGFVANHLERNGIDGRQSRFHG